MLLAGLFAIVGLACVFVVADDSQAWSVDIEGDSYVKAEGTIRYTMTSIDANNYNWTAELVNSDGAVQAGALNSTSGDFSSSRTLTVTAPKASGDYRLVVHILDADKSEVAKRVVPLKVVDPIKLSVTIENKSDISRTFIVYFNINGEKIEDSKQTVTVSASATKVVSYNYIVKDPIETTYYLETETNTLGGDIKGLGSENSHTYYVTDNDYMWVEIICVVLLIVLAIIAAYIYRKPVKNYGKPKSRR